MRVCTERERENKNNGLVSCIYSIGRLWRVIFRSHTENCVNHRLTLVKHLIVLPALRSFQFYQRQLETLRFLPALELADAGFRWFEQDVEQIKPWSFAPWISFRKNKVCICLVFHKCYAFLIPRRFQQQVCFYASPLALSLSLSRIVCLFVCTLSRVNHSR